MKTITHNISWGAEMERFVETDSKTKGFSTLSAYLQELVRKEQERQIEKDVAFLEKAISSAPNGPEPIEEIVAAQKRARAKLAKR